MKNNLPLYLRIRNIVLFTNEILGLPLHDGQIEWLNKSNRLINILKPANQWGKTTIEAIKHIYQAVCKPQLDRFDMDFATWGRVRYETLNFGKTYEVAKGVMEHIIDITEGEYLLPDGTFNKSLLKGWAIRKVDEPPRLPRIIWYNNSVNLIRSYDGLGESFKRKKLAFVGGDECGDIPELNLFLNGTLIPRVVFYKGSIDLVGTSQPKGLEYEEISERAEKAYADDPDNGDYFVISANNNPEVAQIYQNKFMPTGHLKRVEAIADPELRRQIIYGFYVDWTRHIYSWEEVIQMFSENLPYDKETGFSELPEKNAFYVWATDMAASTDETSSTCIRYNIKKTLPTGEDFYFPNKVVYHKAWKGNSFPLSLQYEMIKQDFMKFKIVSPMRTKFVYDAGSLGGKNAGQAFADLHGYPFPPKGRGYADVKAEGFGKLKELAGKNRKFSFNEKGVKVDDNPNWGGLRISPLLKELRRQIEVASMDDVALKNDQFSSLMMAVHFIEARVPKGIHSKAIDFNINKSFNFARG